MRTTVRIDDALLKEAKEKAAPSHRTLAAVIEERLRQSLSRQRRASHGRRRARLPTAGRGGLQPGVDLDNMAALLDRLRRSDDSR